MGPANSDLILKTIKVDQTSIIKITGHIIRTFSGRADAYLKYQRKHTLDTSLTYTNNKRWEDVKLHCTGTFGKGTHTFSIRANRPNAFGCGGSWGDIDILVLPQKNGIIDLSNCHCFGRVAFSCFLEFLFLIDIRHFSINYSS